MLVVKTLEVDETISSSISKIISSGGATGGPARHWPTQFSVWSTQFIGPIKIFGPLIFLCFAHLAFLRSKNVLMIYILGQ